MITTSMEAINLWADASIEDDRENVVGRERWRTKGFRSR